MIVLSLPWAGQSVNMDLYQGLLMMINKCLMLMLREEFTPFLSVGFQSRLEIANSNFIVKNTNIYDYTVILFRCQSFI